MSYQKPLLLILALVVLSVFAYQKLNVDLSRAEAQTPQKLIKSEEKVRQEMIIISRQLGVTCTECHNVQNFKNADKKSFKVALEHMKITALLSDHGMNGKTGPAASCFMCHQGKLSPVFRENIVE